MTRSKAKTKRERGSIDTLPSGALRVRVYAGIDPVTKKRHYLTDVIPAGPKAEELAEAARTRLLHDLDERNHPRTNATLNQLLNKHLELIDVEGSTKKRYRECADNHIRPLIGAEKVGSIDADILDAFYAELRRCRAHCRGRSQVDHRTTRPHDCDDRCRSHECNPLAAWTIRKIHFLLSGAYKRAIRWKWVSANPVNQAEPPTAPPPNPQPPSAKQAAEILTEAWKDADFGPLVWLTMTTGCRRGELCAVRWARFDPERKVVELQSSIAQDGAQIHEKDTKTHQRRHVALDEESVAVLLEYQALCAKRAEALGISFKTDAYMFSSSPDGSTPLKPKSVSQRYDRLVERLGIETTFHKLRHYSATELIAAGVDIRTVAGRLGHAGGGTTTLKVYAAWVSEADQRASSALLNRMPKRPAAPPHPSERAKTDPRTPYEKIAAELYRQILDGALANSEPLAPVVQLAREHGVSVGTAHRAVTLLKSWGVIEVSRGRRALVVQPPAAKEAPPVSAAHQVDVATSRPNATSQAKSNQSPMQPQLMDLEVVYLGNVVRKLRAEVDPNDAVALRQLLLSAIKRLGYDAAEVSDFELDLRLAGELVTTYVAAA